MPLARRKITPLERGLKSLSGPIFLKTGPFLKILTGNHRDFWKNVILALLAWLGPKKFFSNFLLHEANLLCLLYKLCLGIKRISMKKLAIRKHAKFKKINPQKMLIFRNSPSAPPGAPMAGSRFLRSFGTLLGPVDPRPWLNSPDPFSGLTCFLLHSVLSCYWIYQIKTNEPVSKKL